MLKDVPKHSKQDLLETLLADLGKNYDPNAALNFLKLLETQTDPKNVLLAKKNLSSLLENPPNEDTSLHVIYQTPYVLGEVVLAGKKTISDHPLCKFYPIHFKKTYLKALSRWETNPTHEAHQSHKIWQHFESENEPKPKPDQKSSIPLPLGSNPNSYRSQLLEAKSLGSLSPVNSNGTAEEIVKQIIFCKKNKASFKKIWTGIEDLNQKIKILHKGGFLHNDLHKENLLLRETENGMQGCLIDFETSEEDDRFQTLDWDQATKTDKRHFLKESCLIFLCAPKKEQEEFTKNTQFYKEILNTLKSDPLLITIQKNIEEKKLKQLSPNNSLELSESSI